MSQEMQTVQLRDAIRQAISEEMRLHENIVVMGGGR